MDYKKYKSTFELNTLLIRVELAKKEKSQAWLAKQIGVSRQNFNYFWKRKHLKYVENIARILKTSEADLLSAKDLIK